MKPLRGIMKHDPRRASRMSARSRASQRSRVSQRSTVSDYRSKSDPIAIDERLEMTQAEVTEAEAAAVNPELVAMVNRAAKTTVRSALVRKEIAPDSDVDSLDGEQGPTFEYNLADTILTRQAAAVTVPTRIVTVPMDFDDDSMGELMLHNLT